MICEPMESQAAKPFKQDRLLSNWKFANSGLLLSMAKVPKCEAYHQVLLEQEKGSIALVYCQSPDGDDPPGLTVTGLIDYTSDRAPERFLFFNSTDPEAGVSELARLVREGWVSVWADPGIARRILKAAETHPSRMKRWRNRNVKDEVCQGCRQVPPLDGKVLCSRCSVFQQARSYAYRFQLKAKEQCTNCKAALSVQELANDLVHCLKCRVIRAKKAKDAYHRSNSG